MRKPGSKGPETLRNLRSAAIELLSERSYQGMNLRLLASKLRLQAASLYNYIDSKQQLLFWLMKDLNEKLVQGFDANVAGIDDPIEQMLTFIAFHLGYHIANRQESTVLITEMRSLTPQNSRAVKKLQRQYTDKIQQLIERGIEQGKFRAVDARIATFAVLQMLTFVVRWYNPRGRLRENELIDVYTDMVFAMLGAGETRAAADNSKHHAHAGANNVAKLPVAHSFDLGSHVVQVSIGLQPKSDH